jgi:hypothetical protein
LTINFDVCKLYKKSAELKVFLSLLALHMMKLMDFENFLIYEEICGIFWDSVALEVSSFCSVSLRASSKICRYTVASCADERGGAVLWSSM